MKPSPVRALPETPLTLRVPAVAALLSASPRTVYDWIASGKLRCIRVGGVVLVRRTEVDAFLERYEGRLAG